MDHVVTSASSVVAAATGVTVFGVVTGLDYPVLLAGFFGGIAYLSFVGVEGWVKRFMSLFTSTITAGYVAPLVLGLLAKWLDLDNMPASGAPLAGFLVGLGAQISIPTFLSWIKRRGEKQDAQA